MDISVTRVPVFGASAKAPNACIALACPKAAPNFNVNLRATTAKNSDYDATVATEISHGTGKKAKPTPDTDTNARSGADSNMDLHGTANLGSVFPVSVDNSIAMWSCVSQSNLHEMERDGNEQDWTSSIFNLTSQQMDAGLAFLDTVPGLLPWENGDCSCLWSELVKTTTDSGSDMIGDKNSPDVCISQLSQLSNRLSSLYRWSCAIADNAESPFRSGDPSQAHQSSLINDAAFKLVASWLVLVSADMNIFPCMDHKTSGSYQGVSAIL
ncbi:hypothetical protein EYZ11_008388 [Aspergillus tanneri]|uniref:Uncharacterized protein n=1 Tax=Aspergillus tanneri TaxID=1220188 RepID=A0A4S3JAJ5_9EURO|nr:hypothetical protein EYZ11_008388 [Aspergillus tanneri]